MVCVKNQKRFYADRSVGSCLSPTPFKDIDKPIMRNYSIVAYIKDVVRGT
jgi:hypothetical protein